MKNCIQKLRDFKDHYIVIYTFYKLKKFQRFEDQLYFLNGIV